MGFGEFGIFKRDLGCCCEIFKRDLGFWVLDFEIRDVGFRIDMTFFHCLKEETHY